MARPVNPKPVYEDYDPPSDLVIEEGCDTILIYLPGYRKEQLRVQLTPARILKISGERQVGDNKWRRFNKEFRVPVNCDTKEITAKFEGGILYIRQPKIIKPTTPPTATPAAEAVAAAAAPPPPPPQASEISYPPQQQPQQPQPQQLRTPTPLPRQPQAQQNASLPEPQKGSEEGKMDAGKDELSKEEKLDTCKKDDEGNGKCELKPRPREMVGKRGFFTELSKPENCKRLVISVLVVLSIGFYSSYMFKSFMEDDKEL